MIRSTVRIRGLLNSYNGKQKSRSQKLPVTFTNHSIIHQQYANITSLSYFTNPRLVRLFSTTKSHAGSSSNAPGALSEEELNKYFMDEENDYVHYMLLPKAHSIYDEELLSKAGRKHLYFKDPEKYAIFQPEDLEVKQTHFTPQTKSDKFALKAMNLFLKFGNWFTKYKGPGEGMTRENWLDRAIYLETCSGCPGMVSGMVRHLNSLRTMKRDYGWISSLLTESENERMHLVIFLRLKQAGFFYRMKVTLGQALFFNTYFLAYLFSPTTCHRFVGYMNEEGVRVYSDMIRELENAPHLRDFAKELAPVVGKGYYKLKAGATVLDVVKCIRVDEAIHRDVNHKFSSHPIKNAAYIWDYKEPDEDDDTPTKQVRKP